MQERCLKLFEQFLAFGSRIVGIFDEKKPYSKIYDVGESGYKGNGKSIVTNAL